MTQRVGSGPMKRCDSRCYSATHGKCDCICRGVNHGMGLAKALDNVRELLKDQKASESGIVVTRKAERAIRRLLEKVSA